MALLEKRLLWHPRHDCKFVVGGGSQIILYEWAAEYLRIRHITSQQDLHQMKCFAWSPDRTLDDLLAVGFNSGRVDLIRLEAARQTRGERLTSGPCVSLGVHNSRSCNSVAFCDQDTNILVAGLDKVRGESSLLIWDITVAIPLLALDLPLSQDATFSTNSPPTQVSAPTTVTHNSRNEPRIVQHYAPQEIVSCLTFLPKTAHLVLAGISYRWLRLFDLRSSSSNVLSVPGKIQTIATDPFDQYRVASIGDNNISIWDTRKLTSYLMFSERDAAADNAKLRVGSVFSTIEFSSTRRGCLATLEKDSAYVRFWDLVNTTGPSREIVGSTPKGSGKASTKRPWSATLPWQIGGSQVLGTMKQGTSSTDFAASSLVLTNTRRSELVHSISHSISVYFSAKTFTKPLTSFALAPESGLSHPLSSNLMVVNKDGDLEMYAFHDMPKQSAWSARGDLAFGSGVNLKTIPGIPDSAAGHKVVLDSNDCGRSSRSRSAQPRDGSLIRGRPLESESLPPIAPITTAPFGRGDEAGFSVLPSIPPATGLAATRPQQGRTYTPSALRKYHHGQELVDQHQTSQSLGRQVPLFRKLSPTNGKHGLIGGKVESEHAKKMLKSRDAMNREFVKTVEDDISMRMRRRAILGYGLGRSQHNMLITRREYDSCDVKFQALSDLWAWISHSQQLLCVPTARINGYDFAYQGILGVWEGISPVQSRVDITPTVAERPLLELGNQTSFSGRSRRLRRSYSQTQVDDGQAALRAALNDIGSRNTGERSTWKPAVNTTKLVQRRIAMKLCGWNLKEDELGAAIVRWEQEGQNTRAAAWLVFTRQFTKALETLLKSNDMSHKMMSGTIAALIPHATGGSPLRNHELREHCGRLIKDMKDPYFCAIITYLAVGDWADVLKEENIPLRERLAIALRFLDDKTLTIYLRHIIELGVAKGSIDSLIVTGLTNRGMDILQSYVNNTGDVQTAAILGSYVSPHRIPDSRVLRWLETYRDMLDKFKLHAPRVLFDIERGQILTEAMQNGDIPPVELVPKQVMIRCNYCGEPVVPEEETGLTEQAKWRPTTCSSCHRALPRCSVCLLTLSIIPDATREIDVSFAQQKDAVVICQTCRHGGHASHLMEWFFGEDGKSRGICPVADCNCRCAEEF